MAGVAEAETRGGLRLGARLRRSRRVSDAADTTTDVTAHHCTGAGVEPDCDRGGRCSGARRAPTSQSQLSASVPVVVETIARPAPAPTPPAIPRAPFLGEWGMHGMSVTLAPDGSAHYMAWLGAPLGVTWSATWSPMTSTTVMIVLIAQTESHGGAAQRHLYTSEGLTWIDGRRGQALAFTLRGDGYATIQNPSGKLVTLCPQGAGFHDTKGLCGA